MNFSWGPTNFMLLLLSSLLKIFNSLRQSLGAAWKLSNKMLLFWNLEQLVSIHREWSVLQRSSQDREEQPLLHMNKSLFKRSFSRWLSQGQSLLKYLFYSKKMILNNKATCHSTTCDMGCCSQGRDKLQVLLIKQMLNTLIYFHFPPLFFFFLVQYCDKCTTMNRYLS